MVCGTELSVHLCGQERLVCCSLEEKETDREGCVGRGYSFFFFE